MNNNNQFIMENYDERKPFSSFLPGVAGLHGIPMWVYYCNRGQGVAGMGVEDKDGAILDFVPANMAYKRTELHGFRTFIKIEGRVHEIFSTLSTDVYQRKMMIEPNAFGFEEVNETLGLVVTVKYITVTNQPYPGLIRKVEIKNTTNEKKKIEVLDGLMTLWPYKNDNNVTKNMSNLAVAWFEVYNTENKMPFYRNRSTTTDSAAVGKVEAGHFYAAFASDQTGPLPVVYDPEILFGEMTGLLKPVCFEKEALGALLAKPQVSANKLPCAFSTYEGTLESNLTLFSLVGQVAKLDLLKDLAKDFNPAYFLSQEKEADRLGASLTKDVKGHTAFPVFDAYIRQCYLDNLLRGGYPLLFEGKEGPIVYHVYSRIHGDMEREYNDFYVEPAYYSHGVGNYRDVNQNRRNDVYFVKEAGRFNIKQFMELLQLDGQNPLTVKGSKLSVAKEAIGGLLDHVVSGQEVIKTLLLEAFTPGQLLTSIELEGVKLKLDLESFLREVLKEAVQEHHAAYGHGFWVDHWTYNLDLVDNFLNVYPDQLEHLLFNETFRAFESPDVVLPRHKKYVLTHDQTVRQYDAVYRDKQRIKNLGIVANQTNWSHTKRGEVYQSSLFVKLLNLCLVKINAFDPSGYGLMMDTDKPGWNDAMNGLPGLFGSSTNEVIELKRVIRFLKNGFEKYPQTVQISEELQELLSAYMALNTTVKSGQVDALSFWNQAQDAKEAYLDKVYEGLSGQVVDLEIARTERVLNLMLDQVDESLNKALSYGKGIIPSYFVHEATAYEVIEHSYHPINDLPNVRVTGWQMRALPLYLEAPARMMKQLKDKEVALEMYEKIRQSDMYDEPLKMYVTSESLEDETLEIGRARAFTAGWLERESVFMHMSFKYLLGLIKGGLYDQFYEEIKTALPPFMDPKVYGRSVLENSSFIASSRNPNPNNHGRGFVSRLTGTTSEMISMWLHMMTGSKLFSHDGVLRFHLNPQLHADFFDEANTVQTTLFGQTTVTYLNPKRQHTYGQGGVTVKAYELIDEAGQKLRVNEVTGDLAHGVREGRYSQIIAHLD